MNAIPEWGLCRWSVAILAAGAFLLTGISIFHTPAHEVLYAPTIMRVPLRDGGQTLLLSIELGNTGTRKQEDVRLRFSTNTYAHMPVQPYARDFGVSDRPLRTTTSNAWTYVRLGAIEPEQRVRFTAMLLFKEGEPVPPDPALVPDVTAASGKARRGDPGMTLVARAWWSFLNVLPF